MDSLLHILRLMARGLGLALFAALVLVGAANLALVVVASPYLASLHWGARSSQDAAATQVLRWVVMLSDVLVPAALLLVVVGLLRGADRSMLMLRYLRSKLAPIFALIAVCLCTAMVIIVISVMGGFLTMMSGSARKLTGDVTVRAGMYGFPHYGQIIAELRSRPEVQAATPMIHAYGLLNLLGEVHTIEVLGVEPASLDQVVGYGDTLYWEPTKRKAEEMAYYGTAIQDPATLRRVRDEAAERWKWFEDAGGRDLGMTLQAPRQWRQIPVPRQGRPANAGKPAVEEKNRKAPPDDVEPLGMVMGMEVFAGNRRTDEGSYLLRHSDTIGMGVTLTVLPITAKGSLLEPAVERAVVVNEFKSGLYEVDARRVYVPFDRLQRMLQMQEDKAYAQFDPQTGAPLGEPTLVPGRASEIAVKGNPGVAPEALAGVVRSVLDAMSRTRPELYGVEVQTWRQRHAMILGAVEKEKGLLTFLFGFISVVAIFMVAVIFYMIVQGKTKDIGTLRAIGASRFGIASIFLGYGLAIGVIGAGLGLALAAAVVYNLNEIQGLLQHYFQLTIWDRRIYYFERIPTQLDPVEVLYIMTVAVCSSVIGASIPAYLAGRVNPIESLRYE